MNKIEILDAGMGTELISHGEKLPKHIWSASVNLTNPNLVYKIHKSHIDNGSNYIITNTFRTTPRSFRKLGIGTEKAYLQAKKSFDIALEMAKKASGGKIKILGSIAPLEDCYLPELFPNSNKAKKEFEQIGSWFNESRIDAFILETMNSIIETEICLKSIEQFGIPIWVSYNLLNSTQIRSGESLIKAIRMLDNYSVDYLLLNCNSLNRTIKAAKIIKENWSKKWGVYPNIGVGEPSPDGIIKEYHSDEEFLKTIDKIINLEASIIGGCCGADSHHIDLIKNQILK